MTAGRNAPGATYKVTGFCSACFNTRYAARYYTRDYSSNYSSDAAGTDCSVYDAVTRIGRWSDVPRGSECTLSISRPTEVAKSKCPRKNLYLVYVRLSLRVRS